METLIKIADIRHPNDPNYLKCALDGQPIEARWDGFQWGAMERKNFLILRTNDDFWEIRGGNDWKVWNAKAESFKELFSSTDSNGKQRWEFGYLEDEKQLRFRDRFIDIARLLALSKMTSGMYDNLYKHGEEAGVLVVNESLFDLLRYELSNTRTVAPIKNQGITSGVFTIGAGVGPDYATVAGFATDVNAGGTMDGDLRGEHLDEETAISVEVNFDTDTNGNTLFLTAQSGAEHDGGAYGIGARITMGTFDRLDFDETNDGDLDSVEVSKLALDISGNTNMGIKIEDAKSGTLFKIDRMLIKGDADSRYGIWDDQTVVMNLIITNNIVYGIGDELNFGGIIFNTSLTPTEGTYQIYNNTCVKNFNNFLQESSSEIFSPTVLVKNNLAQANTGGSDFIDAGTGFGTTAKNVSEDATSPDAAYRSKDMHAGAATVFQNYATDDYRLDSGGDVTNLAILDDGENLYPAPDNVTEDIQGQARDNGTPFWIGASHIAAAPPAGVTKHNQGLLLGVY